MKWTDEQKAEASRKAKQRWEEKKAQAELEQALAEQPQITENVIGMEVPDEGYEPQYDTYEPSEPAYEPRDTPVAAPIANEDYEDLKRRMLELEAMNWRLMSSMQAPQHTGPQAGQGGLVGTFEKYKIDPDYYPNPIDRLGEEPRLQRFAFKMNYELDWNVGVSSYKTLDGVNTREPKFTIQLHKIMIDEETGEPTNGRYTICQAIFHEDPEAALVVARDNNIEVDENDQKSFLDEMRYLRIRDWLLEAFYMPLSTQSKINKKEIVIGGKLVPYFEINSEDTQAIPFSQLKQKL